MAIAKTVTTRIVARFQTTVPPEMRDLFALREGDLFEWSFDELARAIRIVPKRAELLSPQVRMQLDKVQKERLQFDDVMEEGINHVHEAGTVGT